MFIVYMYEFQDSNLTKNKYIGSKSNCIIQDGVIITNNGTIYRGSSTDPEYHYLWHFTKPNLHILYEGKNSEDILRMEREIIISLNAHKNSEYFNKAIPAESNYTYSEFGTFKDTLTGKTQRVSCNDYRVLSGRFVGATHGVKLSKEHKANISIGVRKVQNTTEYKEKHAESMAQVRDTIEYRDNLSKGQTKRWSNATEEEREGMYEKCWGLPASDKQKMVASENLKNKITVKSILTGEVRRIDKSSNEYLSYDRNEWKNPYAIRERTEVTCQYCGKKAISSGSFSRWHNENCKLKDVK